MECYRIKSGSMHHKKAFAQSLSTKRITYRPIDKWKNLSTVYFYSFHLYVAIARLVSIPKMCGAFLVRKDRHIHPSQSDLVAASLTVMSQSTAISSINSSSKVGII